MSIIKQEFYKVLNKKILWVIIAILFFLNGFIYVKRDKFKNSIDIKGYDEVVEEYKDLPIEDALKKITALDAEMFFNQFIIYYRENNVNEDLIKFEIQYGVDARKLPFNYDDILKKYENTPYLTDREFSHRARVNISRIKDQLQYFLDYKKSMETMEKKAKDIQSISVFNNSNSFVIRNAIKTSKDFEKFKNLSFKLGDELGVVSCTSYEVTDYIMVSLIFLICVYLFSIERDKGLFNIVRCNKSGRKEVIISKLVVLSISVVVLSFIFYGSILIIGKNIYGFGDISRTLQSMTSFRDCKVFLTVKEYLISFMVIKIMVCIATAFVFSAVFLLASDSKNSYVILGTFLCVSYLCYFFIDSFSYFNVLKYINIFSFFNVFNLFSQYFNLNIFGHPVGSINIILCSIFISLIGALCVNLYAFNKCYLKSESFIGEIFNKLSLKHNKIKGTTNILFHESYKNLIINKSWIIVVVAIVISYNNIMFKEPLLSIDAGAYKAYSENLVGEISNEKEEQIKKSQKEFDNISIKTKELYSELKNNKIEKNDYDYNMACLFNLCQGKNGFNRAKSQYEYVKKLNSNEKNISFINELSSDYIFNNINRDLKNGAIYSILLILCLSSIFTEDYKNNKISILKNTKNGRKKLFLKKYSLAYIIAIVLMVIIYAPQYINLISKYNLQCWNAPIQSIRIFEHINMNVSILGFIILCMVLQLFTAMVMATFVLFISQLVKTQVSTIFLSSILFFVPFLIGLMDISFINFYTLNRGFTLFNYASKSEFGLTNIIYFILILLFSVICIVFNFKVHDGRKINIKAK